MRIVFMGSDDLSCPSLAALLESERDTVVGVVTQPDRPRGRSLHLAPCAVKADALRRGVPVLTPARVNAPEALAEVRALAPELIVVIAYGQILRRELLLLPPLGCVNVHTSLLPRYRGAAPVQWAIVEGETVTGVTTMYMNEGLDTGDIIFQQAVEISAEDTAGTLEGRLAAAGAALLVKTLDAIRRGAAPRTPQQDAEATVARKLRKEDGRVDWSLPAGRIERRVRGFQPWPGCYAAMGGPSGTCTMKILRARVEAGEGLPGTVLEARGDGPLVATGEGALRLLVVQPEGRKAMEGRAFLCGRALVAGDRLG